MSEAKRRRTDRGWHRLIRENAYRDAWLLIVSGCVLFAIVVSAQQASRANELAHEIQQQRLTNLRATCESSNGRHDATVAELRRRLADARLPSPKVRATIAFTVPLIEQLAPKQNCALVVQRAQRQH